MPVSTSARLACTAALLAAAAPAWAGAALVSTFDTGDDGWTAYGDAQGASDSLTHNPTGGVSGGFVSAVDDVTGGIWYFDAPAASLGDFSAAYGTTLTFSLIQIARNGNSIERDDVVLVGANGTTIVYDLADAPTSEWTDYAAPILAGEGWTVGTRTGDAATEAEIRAVLADVTAFRIRGEYINGADTAGLDNVALVPEPASLALLLATGGLLATRRRR